MGGERLSSSTFSPEEESSLVQDFSEISSETPTYLRDGLSMKVEGGTVSGDSGRLEFREFEEVGHPISSRSVDFDAYESWRRSVYRQILQSYDDLRVRSESMEEAKRKILSYTPGAWMENVGGMKLSDYEVPKSTSLILIGPKGSGKSSLINRISRVFEDDKFAPERAQVSCNSSFGDGTYFLQEYMIPRGSTSFSLYDTRSLSDDSFYNIEMLKRWMTKGVHHGELVVRDSDSSSLRARMKCKARQNGYLSSEIRMANFVIFVVNGLSVLKSMESEDESEKEYAQKIATTFNCPYLSFKDDKPVTVVTHGDLLSLSDRARIRVHLGELLGVPPAKQIFDIPESCDPATELTIVDMLRYSLEHADRNLPYKDWVMGKVRTVSLPACIVLVVILGIAIISAHLQRAHMHRAPRSKTHIDWHTIRHLWLD